MHPYGAVQVGIPVLVLEKGAGLREEGAAITFWPNAFRVLDELEVAGPLRKTHPLLERHGLVPMRCHATCQHQPCSAEGGWPSVGLHQLSSRRLTALSESVFMGTSTSAFGDSGVTLSGQLREIPPVSQCRVEIATHKGEVLTAFGLDECPGGPHEARIVRRAALLDALRSALPPHAIRYGASVSAVRTTAQGVYAANPLLRLLVLCS